MERGGVGGAPDVVSGDVEGGSAGERVESQKNFTRTSFTGIFQESGLIAIFLVIKVVQAFSF